jgi:pimeloyl-ACP methyl ester carboxylesterase
LARVDLPDGRAVAIEDRGPVSGRTVVLLHPAPGSRLLDPDPWATAAGRRRLVTFDRPGYGGSSPLPTRAVPSISGYADDAAAVLERLGIRRTSVVGWSAGGLVALALAARRPDLVRAVAIVGTPAHDDDVARLDADTRAMVEALRPNLAAAAPAVAQALAAIARAPHAILDLLADGPADEALRADAVHGPALFNMAAEALRQGVTGVAADIVASTIAPWGFDPKAVEVPVALWYGQEDALVPPDHGAWWAGVLPTSTLTVVPGAGHLLPLLAWKQILASVK